MANEENRIFFSMQTQTPHNYDSCADYTESCNVLRVVMQEYYKGDTLAPYLFIISLDYVLRTLIDKIRENGFKLTKRRSRKYPATTITKAFNSIHRGKMEQILLAYGIPKETVAAITILYRNTKVKVRSPDGDTE